MQSMSDVMHDCKNFSPALDALHSRRSWIFQGAQNITHDDCVQKFAIDCASSRAPIGLLRPKTAQALGRMGVAPVSNLRQDSLPNRRTIARRWLD
ncbi:hypothetical protein B7L66_10075 [Xanthomonas citri pv. citri]|nr:hypothetical protein B7L66_10075 [Xanthomonas citri pv. citri]QYF45024.1 hypothetical protein HZS93_02335 [Xanthomonas citri]ARR17846.1 hypothetical protein B7L65_13715 [Xanthomonas citri pv. citri]ARR23755.1 hypothetical protein B7L67_21205 [Xanthomonas citri pv. citri]AUZ51191.1 hypothetical protein CLM98_12000 [Xanthomonas citri pv. citri]